MSRSQELSQAKSENTSRMWPASLNKDTVNEYSKNYVSTLKDFHSTGDEIYNLNEIGIPTVLNPVNVVLKVLDNHKAPVSVENIT